MGELEEQLKETEEERLKREAAMKAELDDANLKITKLEVELRKAMEDVHQWRRANSRTEELLQAEKNEKEDLRTELAYLRAGAKATSTDAVALPPRRTTRKQTQMLQQQKQNQIQAAAASLLPVLKREPESPPAPHPLGCGTCSSTSRCACVEQVITFAAACGRCRSDSVCTCVEEVPNSLNTALMPDLDMKRAFASSSPISSHKRARISIEDITPQEIDFTAMFSRPAAAPQVQQQTQPPHSMHREEVVRDYIDLTTARPPPGETCGFCDDSTYCACAEAAAAQARDREMENNLPPLMNEVTPPPSDSDGPSPFTNTSEYKLPSLYPNHRIYQSSALPQQAQQQPAQKSAGNSCANGPGTCQQCLDDPKSGLFCRSLAAIRAQNPSFSGCCGNGGPGGCCKDDSSKSAPAPQQPAAPRPSNAQMVTGASAGVKLSCAETYKTLASHAHFDDAAGQLGEWLPKLATLPRREEGRQGQGSEMYPGRGAMDIDAASVMSVIKYFDVRFGRE